MRSLAGLLFLGLSLPCYGQQYRVIGSVPLKGSGAWDYLRADAPSRRLYVSHGTTVAVLDLDSHRQIGEMNGFGFIHGIVILSSGKKGYLSDGQKDEVLTFDPLTLKITGRVKTEANPNSMVYDQQTGRLFIGHKPSRSATILDTASDRIEKTLPLGGIPEFPATDGKSFFVNIEDKNEIVQVDTHSLAITGHFQWHPAKGPPGWPSTLSTIGSSLPATTRRWQS